MPHDTASASQVDSADRVDREASGDYDPDLYNSAVTAQTLGGLDDVDDAALGRYRDDGYLAVAGVLTPAQVADAFAGLTSQLVHPSGATWIEFEPWAADRLDTLDGPARMDAVRKLMRFAASDDRLNAIAHGDRLLAVVRRILGVQDVVMFQDMALLKPPHGGREKPWHQDKAYFNYDLQAPVVGVWIALDPATPENGCMHVIPGSHREGPVIHFRRRDWQICDTDVQRERDVVVPLPSGGAMFFDGLIHHGTPANRTDTRRRALQFHYVPRGAITVDETEHLAAFGSEGKGATC